MELGIVEGLFDMCEKYFGQKATKALGGLIVITIVCMCFVFIISEVIIPIYKFIESFIESKVPLKINPFRITWSIFVAVICAFLSMTLYDVLTRPLKREMAKINGDIRGVYEKSNLMQQEFLDHVNNVIDVTNLINEGRIASGLEPIKFPDCIMDEEFSKLLSDRRNITSKRPLLIPDKSASQP
jgi:hypothetical protein